MLRVSSLFAMLATYADHLSSSTGSAGSPLSHSGLSGGRPSSALRDSQRMVFRRCCKRRPWWQRMEAWTCGHRSGPSRSAQRVQPTKNRCSFFHFTTAAQAYMLEALPQAGHRGAKRHDASVLGCSRMQLQPFPQTWPFRPATQSCVDCALNSRGQLCNCLLASAILL